MREVAKVGAVISQAVILTIFLSGVFSLFLVSGEGLGGGSLLPHIPLIYDASLWLADFLWRPFYEYAVVSPSFSPDPDDFERFKRVHAFFMQFALPMTAFYSASYAFRRVRKLGSELG